MLKILPAQEKEICEHYKNGLSTPKIAKIYSVSSGTIQNVLNRNKIKMRSLSDRHAQYLDKANEMCQMYKDGQSTIKIGRYFGISAPAVGEYLERNGVPRRSIGESLRKHYLDESKVCKLYLSGVSTPKIGKKFGADASVIRKILKKNGMTMRSRSESRRQFDLDETAFDKINPDSAYWLGFIVADGCIRVLEDGHKYLSIQLCDVDLNHLYKFRRFMKTNRPIYYKKQNSTLAKKGFVCSCRIDIASERVIDKVMEYGITPRKSLSADVVETLVLNKDFWRGMIDGDGWISGKNKDVLGLCGSFQICSKFAVFLRHYTGEVYNVHRDKSIYRITIGGKRGIEIIKFLYQKSPIYLTRKYKIARKHF